MNPDQLTQALVALGFDPAVASKQLPEIRQGEDARAWDYHLVHLPDGRVGVGLPNERSNKTWIVTWDNGPAVFATADEARAVIFELIKRKEETYGSHGDPSP